MAVPERKPVPAYRRDSRLLILPALLFQIAFFFVPLFMVAKESLFDPDFTGRHYGEVFTNHVYRKVLLPDAAAGRRSSRRSPCALGYPVAYFISRARPVVAASHAARGARAAVDQPAGPHLLVPGAVRARGLRQQAAASGSGVIDEPLPLMFNTFTAVSGMVHALLPFVILPCLAVMRGIDRSLPNAAKSLGRRRRGGRSATCTSR